MNRLSLSFASLFAVCTLIGCGAPDPCAGESGACLAVRLEGNVGSLDAVRFDLSGAVTHRFTSTFTEKHGLPAAIAVLLPDDASGTVRVRADGVRDAAQIASGSGSVEVQPGAKAHVTLQLKAQNGMSDGGVPDGGDIPDLTMADMAMPDLMASDLAMSDMAEPDLAMSDMAALDLAVSDMAMSPDLKMPDMTVIGCTTSNDCSGLVCCDDGTGSGAKACIDTRGDRLNCGGCGVTCQGGLQCCNSACLDPSGDANNCGGCNLVCSSNHIVTPACSGGVCNGACAAGYDDCNSNKQTDGCETNTQTDANNCGACNNKCTAVNGTATCANSACGIGSCNGNWVDCDGQYANGCECDTSSSYCKSGVCTPIFIKPAVYPVGVEGVNTVTVGDFDEDGYPDVMTTGKAGIYEFVNKKNGLFTDAVAFKPYGLPTLWVGTGTIYALQIHTDVAAFDTNGVIVAQGDGNAGFNLSRSISLLSPIIAMDRFDVDSFSDLILVDGNKISLALGNTKDGFAAPKAVATAYDAGVAVISAHFSNTTYPDLALIVGNAVQIATNVRAVFTPREPLKAGSCPAALAAGDFDKDGQPDLVVGDRCDGSLYFLTVSTTGVLKIVNSMQVANQIVGSLAVADFDGDGNLDVAAGTAGKNTLAVIFGSGSVTKFHSPYYFNVGQLDSTDSKWAGPVTSLQVADFDKNGYPDLVAAGNGDSISVLLNGKHQ